MIKKKQRMLKILKKNLLGEVKQFVGGNLTKKQSAAFSIQFHHLKNTFKDTFIGYLL